MLWDAEEDAFWPWRRAPVVAADLVAPAPPTAPTAMEVDSTPAPSIASPVETDAVLVQAG